MSRGVLRSLRPLDLFGSETHGQKVAAVSGNSGAHNGRVRNVRDPFQRCQSAYG